MLSIHTLQLNFLFLIGSLVNTWSVLKMSTALRVRAPGLRDVLSVRERHIDWSIFFTGWS